MSYRQFLALLIFCLLLFKGGQFYLQYKEVNRTGGTVELLGHTIYSSPGNKQTPGETELTGTIGLLDKKFRLAKKPSRQTQYSACPPRKEKQVQYKPEDLFYSWKTDDGRKIFTNQSPEIITPDSSINDFKKHIYTLPDRYFDLNIEFYPSISYGELHEKLDTSLRNVYLIVAYLLGKERLRLSTVNLRVYTNESHYQEFRRAAAPELNENYDGFFTYSNGRGLAVTYNQGNLKRTLENSIHESFHVLAHELFVNPPTWFNEGMAKYFETLSVNGKTISIHPQKYWNDTAQKMLISRRITLKNLVTMPYVKFYGDNHELHYASAWSLISFLMSNRQGQQFLTTYMQFLFDHYCMEITSTPLIEHYYPGGMKAMQTGWYQWILKEHNTPQKWIF